MGSDKIENDERKSQKKSKRKWKRTLRILVLICMLLIVAAAAVYLLRERAGRGSRESLVDTIEESVVDAVEGEEGKIVTISEATLEKVFDIEELSTVNYTYNAIARAYEKDETTVRYYIAYEGQVKAGIDFDKIKYEVGEETITITLPEVEFHEMTVNPGTLEFIFCDKDSETETVHREAYAICEADLVKRVGQEEGLLVQAKENTEAVVDALVTPWVKQMNDKYDIKIQWGTGE